MKLENTSGVTTGCVLSINIDSILVTLNSNFAIINTYIKLFSIRVKELCLFEPMVLRKKATGFCSALFKSIFSETDLCVTLSDFYGKNTPKIGKGNLFLTENMVCVR